ncbi:MAG: ATPase [Actinomycetia bacterium]|nr:ATPase [Actinomycetes bacterium]
MTTAAPGWYPDSYNPAFVRWWDGIGWTEHTQPAQPMAPVYPAQGTVPSMPAPEAETGHPAHSPQHKMPGGKRELQAEVERLQKIVDSMGVEQLERLRAEERMLADELPRLRHEQGALQAALGPLRAEAAHLSAYQAQVASLREEVTFLQAQRYEMAAATREAERLDAAMAQLRIEHAELTRTLVETRETALLQEAGVYQYRHPMDDAIAYKAKLAGLQARIKDAVRAGSAVKGATNWTVNGSSVEGNKMVREFSKLMLRAYNNEAEHAVHTMKPYALESTIARLEKARETISKLGATMKINVTDSYHRLRVEELQLTSDYLAKVAEEKERAKEERARLREEEIARREYEREQERLRKEQAHYVATLAALKDNGDIVGAEKMQAKLAEIQDALDGISRRAANIRAGHVYVISNLGAFGPEMVKIGMTRRLDPMDRVRELGDASVPFRYDVHAMVFSNDAVSLETRLHHQFADRRVNLVNTRREFFRVTSAEVRDVLLAGLDASIVSWIDEPEALEWRQSETSRREAGDQRPAALYARLPSYLR